jgi:hypothetical protein
MPDAAHTRCDSAFSVQMQFLRFAVTAQHRHWLHEWPHGGQDPDCADTLHKLNTSALRRREELKIPVHTPFRLARGEGPRAICAPENKVAE